MLRIPCGKHSKHVTYHVAKLLTLTVGLLLATFFACPSVSSATNMGTEVSESAMELTTEISEPDMELVTEIAEPALELETNASEPATASSTEITMERAAMPGPQIGEIIEIDDEPVPYDATTITVAMEASVPVLPQTAGIPIQLLCGVGTLLLLMGLFLTKALQETEK